MKVKYYPKISSRKPRFHIHKYLPVKKTSIIPLCKMEKLGFRELGQRLLVALPSPYLTHTPKHFSSSLGIFVWLDAWTPLQHSLPHEYILDDDV